MSEHIPFFIEMAECKHLKQHHIVMYGAVYFYSYQGNGVFKQSYETIGKKLKLTKNPAKEALKHLVSLGIIEDLTPEKRNGPHEYKPLWIPETGIQELLKIAETGYQKPVSEIPETGIQKGDRIPETGTKKKYKENKNGKAGKPPAKKPSDIGRPKTQLSNLFTQLTKIPLPKNKPDSRYWWSRIGELYEIAERDVDIGACLVKRSVVKLQSDGLTISDPGSIVKTARALMAEQKQLTTIDLAKIGNEGSLVL